jgi:predicted AlkP superfamily pyrophosphatase or phosphodiesterase
MNGKLCAAYFCLLSVLLSLVGSTAAQSRMRDLKPTVILISLDGFRWDYLERHRPPALTKLSQRGVRAKRLIPSFPTKTFPNHYTIVTGLYPQNHGIVENNVYDFGEIFTMSKRKEVQNSRWWWGEPIWVTVEKHGLKASSYFWPGSEAKIADTYATYWRNYNGRIPNAMRIDALLKDLDRPAKDRPVFLTTYFSTTDDVGHEFGPDSEEIKYAVWEVDDYIARLVKGLSTRGIQDQVHVIITSDHGMAAYDQRNAIVMDDYFNTNDKGLADPILTTGEIWQIFAKPGKTEEILEKLKPIRKAACWRKENIPARLNYSRGRRIAPIVCSANPGWFMTSRERYETQKKSDDFEQIRGAHGHDNQLEVMGATFIAAGPRFKKGFVSEPFENVEIYNLMCEILGVKPARNDGDLNRVKHLLR